MEKIDTRKLPADTLHELRKQSARLRSKGMTFRKIAEIVGAHQETVRRWCKSFEKEGSKALIPKTRGRKAGERRTLTPEQEKTIQKWIKEKDPNQLKLDFCLWNRRAIVLLIKQEFDIEMPIRTVGEYLKRWGFTPQKPLRRAYEQNPKAVDAWLEDEFPSIKERAKLEKAEIHWGDETGLRTDSQHGRSYAPKGKTPAIRIPAKRDRANMISAITNQGKVRFMIYTETMNATVLIRFMKRLIQDAGRMVFLILDNLRVHHSKVVKQWLAENAERIEVFYLPSYSPELNPDEYLNCDLKAGVHSKKPARNQKQLKAKVLSHMRMLQKMPSRVKKYFQHPKISYAAYPVY